MRPRRGDQPETAASATWTTHAVDPRFTRDDIRRISTPGAFQAGRAWVLHHRRARGFDEFRIDVADLGARVPPSAPSWRVQVGDLIVDLAAGRSTRRCRLSTSQPTR